MHVCVCVCAYVYVCVHVCVCVHVRVRVCVCVVDIVVVVMIQVLIPVFALGRAQELCILLESYWERMNLNIPIYFSLGLTEKVISLLSLAWSDHVAHALVLYLLKASPAVSTFSPVRSLSSSGLKLHVLVCCVRNSTLA